MNDSSGQRWGSSGLHLMAGGVMALRLFVVSVSRRV